jgi:hypothetical protein
MQCNAMQYIPSIIQLITSLCTLALEVDHIIVLTVLSEYKKN